MRIEIFVKPRFCPLCGSPLHRRDWSGRYECSNPNCPVVMWSWEYSPSGKYLVEPHFDASQIKEDFLPSVQKMNKRGDVKDANLQFAGFQ